MDTHYPSKAHAVCW